MRAVLAAHKLLYRVVMQTIFTLTWTPLAVWLLTAMTVSPSRDFIVLFLRYFVMTIFLQSIRFGFKFQLGIVTSLQL